MAQIFASERSTTAPRPARSFQETRKTAPEQALAGLQAKADKSSATTRLSQLQAREGLAVQRMEEEELQGKFKTDAVQRMEEEELQGKFKTDALQRQESGAATQGGMPRSLQRGIEQLSGADLSGVNVHYNSSAPATVGAHAYAQGNDIHLGSGQEQHLPHEAWHVVQQKEGRVQPTVDVAGMPVNDDPGLEKEADIMGARASQMVSKDADL